MAPPKTEAGPQFLGKQVTPAFHSMPTLFTDTFFLVKKLSLPELKLCSLPLCY